VTRLIRIRAQSLNKWDREEFGKLKGFGRSWNRVLGWDFWDLVQRRGAHVNIPELGSRDG
jgi:hypothetical protein